MHESDWEAAQGIFEQAVDLPPEERERLLDRMCGSNVELRAEVAALLDHDSRASAVFLAGPLARANPPQEVVPRWAERLLGGRIGRFSIEGVVAFGGMGCVFRANQDQPSRLVALKVLPPALATGTAAARFRAESEILGRLQHPNIAQVYEAGIHSDEAGELFYFAMELILQARSLTTFANEEHLSRKQRLRLFVKVCDAVQHGHRKGIIHRDLKPANILVGRDGEPKVIDFGVARSTNADVMLTTQHTRTGDLVGTIRYMSPEQCDGEPATIDTRSDVYSLGVVLYELLLGVGPYETEGNTFYAVMRAIKEELPRLPSTVVGPRGRATRQLRGDLDAILLKAIEKEPARRYDSAGDLASDIRKHLAGDLVNARSPGPWRRLLLRAARRPAFTAMWATALVCGLLIGGTAIGINLSLRYYLEEPVAIKQNVDGTVSLLNRLETPVRAWSGANGGALITPFHDDREQQRVIIGFSTRSNSDRARQLQLYDARGDIDQPLWTWKMTAEHLPTELHPDTRVEQFSPAPHFWTFNIFAESSAPRADEIVCEFANNDNSLRSLCIFSVNGDLRYSIWNDGGIFSTYWAPEPSLLICGAENWDVSPYQRGCSETTPDAQSILVVFALRPKLGSITPRFVDSSAGGASGEIGWYRWLSQCPIPNASWGWSIGPPASGDPSAIAKLNLTINTEPQGFMTWEIDAKGERVQGTLHAPAYTLVRESHPELPPIDAFHLQDTPPGG